MICRTQTRGFTLIEFAIAIAFLAVIIMIAIPNFVAWGSNLRLKQAARDVISNLQKSRLESVKRNSNLVVISFSPGAYNPVGEVGSYNVFIDDGAGGGVAGDFTQNGSESTLLQEAMPTSVSLYQTSFAVQTNQTNFNTRGVPSEAGTIDLRNNNSKFYRVVLMAAGNVRLLSSIDGITWN